MSDAVVRDIAALLERAGVGGEVVPSVSMAELWARFEVARATAVTAETMRGHRSRWSRWVEPFVGEMPIGEVGPAVVDELVGRVAATGAASNAKKVYLTLCAMFDVAVRYRLIGEHPLRGQVNVPKSRAAERPLPTDDDMSAIWAELEYLDDLRWLAFFRLAWATGARPAELCALRWEDVTVGVDEAARTVHIGGGLQRVAGGQQVGTGKSSNARRDVVVDAETARIMTMWWASQDPLAAWVFPAVTNLAVPMSPDAASRRWRQLREQCGLDPRIRLYDLRHRFGTRAMAAGFSPVDVAAQLGNTAALVMDTYGHKSNVGEQISDAVTKEES